MKTLPTEAALAIAADDEVRRDEGSERESCGGNELISNTRCLRLSAAVNSFSPIIFGQVGLITNAS